MFQESKLRKRATTLASVTIKAFIHPSLNNSKGVICTRELQNMDKAEITSELKQLGMADFVKRITIKKSLSDNYNR